MRSNNIKILEKKSSAYLQYKKILEKKSSSYLQYQNP